MRRSGTFCLLVLVAMLSLVATGCGDDKSDAKSGVNPEQRVKTALANASTIKSGKIAIDATFSGGGMPGAFKVTGGGPMDLDSDGGTAIDLTLAIDLGGTTQSIGFTSVDGASYVKFGDKAFSTGKAEDGEGAIGAIDPGQLHELLESLDKYVSDIKPAGTTELDGETLDVYSANVNVSKLVNDLQKQSAKSLPNIPGLGDTEDLAGSLGETTVQIGIDDKDLPRSIQINATYKGDAETTSGAPGGMKIGLQLTDVNQPVTITKPKNVVEGTEALQALGAMFGGLSGN